LNTGELTQPVSLEVTRATKSAKDLVEKNGGTVKFV
jgi:ribosomal protein L15